MKWATLPQKHVNNFYTYSLLNYPKNMMIMIIIMTIMAFWCILTSFLFQVNPLGTLCDFDLLMRMRISTNYDVL